MARRRICMNEGCKWTEEGGASASTATIEWKRGWDLKSGGFATLCSHCGSAYENLVYCETFHVEESGWRECRLCGKRVHCGCVVSKNLHEYLDSGGIGCIRCSKQLENQSLKPVKVQTVNGNTYNGIGPQTANIVEDPQSSAVDSQIDGVRVDKGKLMQLNKAMIENEKLIQLSKTIIETEISAGKIKQEGITVAGEISPAKSFSGLLQQCVGPSFFAKQETVRPSIGAKDMYESVDHPALSFSLGTPFRAVNTLAAPPPVLEEKEQNKAPSFQQGLRACQTYPKPPKADSDSNKATLSEARVARPPAEGRGRSQLLPRYWPRITDQELQQISGDLNSTIEPLFEKVLSASDAGRIGRLVLPKACAEAYFPPISNSEGVSIRIQDIKGKEWTFQFRFWPNNNSRMYVLEGVTPCIQNMNLQAGDTVTFSRINPGGKLVIGFRKASNTGNGQDCQPSAVSNGTACGEASLPGFSDNLLVDGGGTNEGMPHRQKLIPQKKKTRNIGSKSKRLHMHSEDAVELRLTWDEAQELLRPLPSAKPNIVMVEDQAFEEYEEPPVFGKRTIFTARASGKQEQWAQCDNCFKWRRLPVDFLVPPKWTCSENVWDSSRCSCSAAGEMNPAELESFLKVGRDFKKRRIMKKPKLEQEHGSSGLDALATAAFLGENPEPSTTKHPRHRPGCTCIVCIQPPSGKGRHKPTCVCNVCLTVKRRFKTLMLRKKKRQSEREAEISQEKEKAEAEPIPLPNGLEATGMNGNGFPSKSPLDDKKSQLDLNCDPNREEEFLEQGKGRKMCLTEKRVSQPSPSLLSHGAVIGECQPQDEGHLLSTPEEHEDREHGNKVDDG